MGKKMKLPFLSNNNSVQAASSWSWPSCQQQPRTLSFRAEVSATTPQSGFSTSSESPPCGCGDEYGGDPVETVVKGLRSDRLFFEPGESSSILEVTKPTSDDDDDDDGLPFKGSVVLSMESRDPFVDFSKSMEEMVEAQGLKDWEGLEKLLCWYLKANGKALSLLLPLYHSTLLRHLLRVHTLRIILQRRPLVCLTYQIRRRSLRRLIKKMFLHLHHMMFDSILKYCCMYKPLIFRNDTELFPFFPHYFLG
ncbi:hypothetical protein E1A91_D04G113100v1 [Gossypium mustelinum]|uniref:Transcription repressor n=1 Tax=Gossypium mustelinum TaxID=34275 RepID=A0A5D2VE20_GOSMU|nr:hypothetical protein E1A91_D04G113100v1 [Gossypium mustelinum]